MENNNKSLESKANENRWQKFGKRALSELEALPHEALFATLGYLGGEYAGKVASTTRSYIEGGYLESDNLARKIQAFEDIIMGDFKWIGGNLFQNLAQGMQDLEWGIYGGIAGVLAGIYSGRKTSKYIDKRFLSRNNKKIC